MKKKYFFKFFLFTVFATLVTFTACKDYDDDIDDLQEQITKLASKDDLTSQLSTLQSAIDAAKKDAGDALDKVEKLAGLEKKVADLMDELEATNDASFEALKEDLNKKMDELKKEVESTIGVSLYGLRVIPDIVADQGGALPVLSFAPLVTPCGQIAPATLVRYQLSPSNVTEDMIDKDNLYFKYNNPTVLTYATGDLNPKAEFVSLKDGVLTVRAFINTEVLESLEGGPQAKDKIVQLQLFVPTTAGSEVNSDWAKVVSSQTSYEDLALVRIPSIISDTINWANYEFPQTLTDAKDLGTKNVTVVDLAYDETLDLLEVVKTMMKSTLSNFNIDTYNLEYAFDLKDLEGETIVYELGSNLTDQQKFLNLVGSEISTRVYDLDGPNPASQDRTPIVHVMLKSKDGAVDCNILDGFIKINIVEAKVEPVPPVTIPVEGNVEAGCEDFVLKVGTQQMNEEFYAKAKVSKTFFHTNYEWTVEDEGVGEIVEISESTDGGVTHSFNLVWTVTSSELADNLDETITKSGMYKYGNNEIKVTFTAAVTQPSVDLGALTIDNYWFNNNSFVKFNTTVPTSTTDDDSANNTFDTNINNVFKTVSNTDLRLDLPAGHTYEYFFDKEENQPVKTYNDITISVSVNGKQLLATRNGVTQTVATIEPQTDAGDILSYNENSDFAKELLNAGPEFMKARLYIDVKRVCEDESTIRLDVKGLNNGDAFNVHFLRPVNVEGQSAEAFIDGVDTGKPGSFIDLKDVVNLSDWRNYSKTSTDFYFEPDNDNYYGFYGVTKISVDKNNIKPIGLKVDGVDLEALPGTIVIGTTSSDIPNLDFGTLTYRNNGAGLDENFILEVPVTVSYKWGDVDTKVQVEVKRTAASESIF